MKLEHLAPYLPYKLKAFNKYMGHKLYREIEASNIMSFIDKSTEAKPVMRPLSDLTKEIEHNGEKFVPKYKLTIEIDENLDFKTYSSSEGGFNTIDSFEIYECYQKLLEWHFDVFGLIEKGEAIDINTLEL